MDVEASTKVTNAALMATIKLAHGAPNGPPFGRRVVFVVISGMLLFPCGYFAGKMIDCGRKRFGVFLLAVNYLLFAAGLFLIGASGFRFSWGWIL